jgi:hypothetical protein
MPWPSRIGTIETVSSSISPSRRKPDPPRPFGLDPCEDLRRLAREEGLAVPPHGGPVREHHDPLARVGPGVEAEDALPGEPPHEQRVDRREERVEAVVLAVEPDRVEPLDAPVGEGDVAVEARGDEDGAVRAVHDRSVARRRR